MSNKYDVSNWKNVSRQNKIELLQKMLPLQGRRSDKRQREFLIDCIKSHGYIKERIINEYTDTDEVEYKEIETDYFPDEFEPQNEWNPNVSTDIHGHHRTFIEPAKGTERLTELQKRAITAEETEFAKIHEIMDNALNGILVDRTELLQSTKQTALKFYQEILNFYKNPLNELKSNSKSVKKGYIALCVYFALLNNQIVIPKEKLVDYFDNTSLSDLPEAEKNMRVILNSKVFDINPSENTLCGMKPWILENLGQWFMDKLNLIISDLPDKNNKNIAAAIYYLGKLKKVKALTQKFISEFCGISTTTISKSVLEIAYFYDTNINLKLKL